MGNLAKGSLVSHVAKPYNEFLRAVLFLTLICSSCSLPGTFDLDAWYVATTGSDENTCASTEEACQTINAAIAKATNLDVIHIAEGIYKVGQNGIIVDKSVILRGAGQQKTFIEYHDLPAFVFNTSEALISVIDSSVTISNMTIRNGPGTGISVFWSARDISVRRTPGVEGLGVALGDGLSNLILNNSQLIGNRIGLFIGDTSTAVVTNVNFSDSEFRGIHNRGSLELSGSLLSSSGRGLFAEGARSNTTVARTTFTDNGAGILSVGSSAGVANLGVYGSTFENNEYGMWGIVSGLNISNSTFSSNDYGIKIEGSNVALSFVTLFNNTSFGLFNSEAVVTLENILIAKNGQDCSTSGTGVFVALFEGANIDTDGSCGAITTYALEDLFIDETLASNGGPTQNHALLVGSPAIDFADGCIDEDQTGKARPIGPACDVGAYEAEGRASEAIEVAKETPQLVEIFTPTPEPVPSATAIRNAACRRGADAAFGVVNFLFEDQTALLIGRLTDNRWFYLGLPDDLGRCWVFADNLELFGQVADLPIFASPELPTSDDGGIDDGEGDGGVGDGGGGDGGGGGSPPDAPSNLSHVCKPGFFEFTLSWKDNSDNEDGFRILKNDSQVGSVGANVKSFVYDPGGSNVASYTVEAYNGNGTAGATLGGVGCLP